MSALRMARVNCIFVLWGKINMSDGQKISVDVALAQSFKALACEQDGAAKLSDGAKKLSDAMIQFNEEGIQKLSDAYHGDVEELF